VEVLWNTSPNLLAVRVPVRGTSARLLDPVGGEMPLKQQDGWWQLDLAPGKAPQPSDPPGYRLDGRPLLLVEQGVQQGEPLAPLREVYYAGVRCPPTVRCDARMLAIERFGLPLGPAVADPSNPGHLYQRFENGILWADGHVGGQVPLGRLMRDVLIGDNLSP